MNEPFGYLLNKYSYRLVLDMADATPMWLCSHVADSLAQPLRAQIPGSLTLGRLHSLSLFRHSHLYNGYYNSTHLRGLW